MNTVGKAILIGIGALAYLSAVAQHEKNSTETTIEVKHSVDVLCMYSDVVKAITSSNMCEGYKHILLKRIPAGACGDYYRAVITVIESVKYDTFIIPQVENITKAFGYKFN